jgi:arylformamidase
MMMRVLMLAVALLWPLASDAAITERWRTLRKVEPMVIVGKSVKDIAYGADARQKLDLYLPARRAAQPPALVVFIHGGGWSQGDKATSSPFMPKGYTEAGYAFASLNYRLAPAATIADMQADLAAAIVKLRTLARHYGYDGSRILLTGHSAGAHLAALLATDTRALNSAGVPLEVLRGVVLLDGAAYSLNFEVALDRPVKNYEAVLGADRRLWPHFAPLIYVASAQRLPPFLLIHVKQRESSAFEAQQMAGALRKRGVRADVYAARGKTHGTLAQDLGKQKDAPTRIVLRFAEDVLR